MPSERAPSLIEVMRRLVEARLLDVHTSIPAKVVKYDAAKQRVDCKPLVRRAFLDESEKRLVESYPVVPGVPVLFPGGGGYRLTFPISDGGTIVDGSPNPVAATTGVLYFTECSLDKWLSGDGSEVDPEIDTAHGLADAFFVPELRTFGRPRSSAPTDHATLGADDGVQIHFRGATIIVGDEPGSDFIALAQKVLDELTKLQTHFVAIESALVTSLGAAGGSLSTAGGNPAFAAVFAAAAAAIAAAGGTLTALSATIGGNAYPAPSSVAASQGKAK